MAAILPAYRDRRFRSLGLWRDGGWLLKAYGIHCDPPADPDALIAPSIVAAAREHVRARLDEASRDGHHYHTGFVVLHQGATENWLLTLWWAYENVCCHVVSRSALGSPERFEVVGGPIMACVWELVVIDFERRAWIETMMAGRADGHARYLERRLPDGWY